MDKNEMKGITNEILNAAIAGIRQGAGEHEDTAVQKAVEQELSYAIQCAAAALVEAQVQDAKIVELLRKYYRIDEHEAASALGAGRLLAARKKGLARKSAQPRKQSNKK